MSPLFHNIFNIFDFKSQITYIYIHLCEILLFDLCFPQYCTSDMSRSGYLFADDFLLYRNWESLQHGRQIAKAIMMYRIIHSIVAIPASQHLQIFGAATRGRLHKHRVPYSRTIYLQGIPSGIRLEPAARGTDSRWIPGGLQARDFSHHTALYSRCFCPVFSLFFNQSWATRHEYIGFIISATMLISFHRFCTSTGKKI